MYVVSKTHHRPICGGALITSRHVLTSGRCTYDNLAGTMDVVVGKTVTSSSDTRLGISQLFKHPSYSDFGTYRWDFLIILLSEPVKFTDSVQP